MARTNTITTPTKNCVTVSGDMEYGQICRVIERESRHFACYIIKDDDDEVVALDSGEVIYDDTLQVEALPAGTTVTITVG
ncbi:hypothetical protein [Oceanidesulfovibrio marinus]|uniref:Uncharacterized protein n=1 Tax=Oceanidesulfovibrio marinus TaxID=370038 RepID=A0ABX6NBR2_9BACT|nr:hypothetical protein [Oceanidesulfovibrio marinus]QJT08025.1 hypothetical protein E8L03_03375 [Oceanidesulfovibrio marinus]